MSTTQPLSSYISANLAGSAYFDCSNSSLLSFGGFAPYTFEAWIKPSQISGVNTIVSRFNGGIEAEYGLWIADGYIQSYRNVGPWVLASPTLLQVNQWYHVATTYDGATLSIYINGVLDSSTAFTSQPSAPDCSMTIGCQFDQGTPTSFFQGEIYEVRVWNNCRQASDIMSSMDNILESAPGLVADFGLWTMPSNDQAFNNLPLNPNGNPGFVLESAALYLGGADYIDCGAEASLSLGGFAPYTFEGWINLGNSNAGGTILSRFNGGIAAEYTLYVTNGTVYSYRNVSPWTVQSQTVLQPNQWYHIATTYDGTNLNLYINGALEASTQFTSQPACPDLNTLVGASFSQGQVANYFNGYIQNLRVWQFALTADAIQNAMTDPVQTDSGLLTNFDFSVAPISDLTTKITPNPTAGCVIEGLVTPLTAPPVQRFDLPKLDAAFVDLLGKAGVNYDLAAFRNTLIAEAADNLPASLDEASRSEQLAAFQSAIDDIYQKIESDPTRVGPHGSVERDGDNYHFHYYSNGKHVNTFSVYAPDVTPLDIWTFNFIFTLVNGFFDLILSISINNSAMGALWKCMTRNATVMQKVALCIAAGAKTASILALIDTLYQTGLLKMAISKLVSWWNLASLMWSLITWINPAYKGYEFGVKVATLAIKLHILVGEIPQPNQGSEEQLEEPELLRA